MFKSRIRLMTAASLGVIVVALLVFVSVSSASTKALNMQTATSAKAFGGMDALVTAAERGDAQPDRPAPDWANYGQMITTSPVRDQDQRFDP